MSRIVFCLLGSRKALCPWTSDWPNCWFFFFVCLFWFLCLLLWELNSQCLTKNSPCRTGTKRVPPTSACWELGLKVCPYTTIQTLVFYFVVFWQPVLRLDFSQQEEQCLKPAERALYWDWMPQNTEVLFPLFLGVSEQTDLQVCELCVNESHIPRNKEESSEGKNISRNVPSLCVSLWEVWGFDRPRSVMNSEPHRPSSQSFSFISTIEFRLSCDWKGHSSYANWECFLNVSSILTLQDTWTHL